MWACSWYQGRWDECALVAIKCTDTQETSAEQTDIYLENYKSNYTWGRYGSTLAELDIE